MVLNPDIFFYVINNSFIVMTKQYLCLLYSIAIHNVLVTNPFNELLSSLSATNQNNYNFKQRKLHG